MRASKQNPIPERNTVIFDPPRSGDCPKCGASSLPAWHKAEDYDYYVKQERNSACEEHGFGPMTTRTLSLEEHLHFLCRCGYRWASSPLDAP